MKNQEVMRILNTIADILELQEVAFKPVAYRRAAMTIEGLVEDVEDIYEKKGLKGLEELAGVGEHIAKKIEEIIVSGKLRYFEQLKKEIDIDIEGLRGVQGLGPKKIKVLHDKLGVRTVVDLEKVLKSHEVAKLEGFGEKSEDLLMKGIVFLKTKPRRFLYAQAVPYVVMIERELGVVMGVKKVEVAGSFRRGKETVGDLDFVVVLKDGAEVGCALNVMKKFVSLPDVSEVLAQGVTKSSIRFSNGLQVDLRVVGEKQLGSALLYFIGNKEHNVEIRKLALSKGYTLNEYGLFELSGKKWVAGRTEEEIYRRLGLRYMEPELREHQGEIEASRRGKLPKLVEEKEVKGYFHNHSIWSDGNGSLLMMAQRAEELGWKFISFNDHFGPVGIAHPLNEKRLEGYVREIEQVRRKVGIRVFSGVEIDILKDGRLPLSAAKLKRVDVVVASLHLSLGMNEQERTKRVCTALENYPITIFGHPQARLLNVREPVQMNLNSVFEVACRRGVFLEINGAPQRMDLAGEQARMAKERGCKFALSVDAHDVTHLEYGKYAVNMARRGWLEKRDVLNCFELKKIEKELQK